MRRHAWSYDPHIVSLRILARQFFKIIDPVSVDRQANDAGSQYRTGMYYYASDDDKPVLESVLNEEKKKHQQPLAVELKPLKNFIRQKNITRITSGKIFGATATSNLTA